MRALALFILVSLLFVSGCGGGVASHSIEGEWFRPSNLVPLKFTFSANGSWKAQRMDLPAGAKFELAGSYEVKGDVLTFTLKTFEVAGVPKDMEKDFRARFDKEIDKPKSSKIVWTGESEFKTTSSNGEQQTYKRIKS